MLPVGIRYVNYAAVTKSDTVPLADNNGVARTADGFFVGMSGDVAIIKNGMVSPVVILAVAGFVYPLQCDKIMSTGTTATGIVAVWL